MGFDKGTARTLCLGSMLGLSGLHRFYLGDFAQGVLYLVSCGLCCVGNYNDWKDMDDLVDKRNIEQAPLSSGDVLSSQHNKQDMKATKKKVTGDKLSGSRTKSALVVVDVQNDFCTNGSLAVPQGDDVVPVINNLIQRNIFDLVAYTQDWHSHDHISFASNNLGSQLFSMKTLDDGTVQMMWPDHCIQHSKGAEFHPSLLRKDTGVVIYKGTNPKIDSYSGFFDNNKAQKTELDDVLKRHNVTDVYVTGLALDYCVKATAVDAQELGYRTYLVEDGCRGIAESSIAEAVDEMKDRGVVIITSSDLLE